jgi:hypothetical protein
MIEEGHGASCRLQTVHALALVPATHAPGSASFAVYVPSLNPVHKVPYLCLVREAPNY